MRLTGGCQCGAVRFAAEKVGGAAICHCRMCQKAFGSAFGPLVTVMNEDLSWTRGHPKYFQSSSAVRRGFCETCGTPLTYVARDDSVEVALGAFDDPGAVPPKAQLSYETRVPWFDTLALLPKRDLNSPPGDFVSYQHPDHDTAEEDDGLGDGG